MPHIDIMLRRTLAQNRRKNKGMEMHAPAVDAEAEPMPSGIVRAQHACHDGI
jgi:hypothetical protein